MARRKSRKKRKRRRKTRRYNKRRRRRTRRRPRRSRRRGGFSIGMNTVNQQMKAKLAYSEAEKVRKKDRKSILWRKGEGKCYICDAKFGRFFGREHHCRSCGEVVCDKHSKNQQKIYRWALYKTQGSENAFRECDLCWKEENKAIQKVSAENENLAIAALRRAMFENCEMPPLKKNREKVIEKCRNRPRAVWGLARLPSPEEIERASNIKNQDNSQYEGRGWTVRNHINKIYGKPEKEEEKETDIMGVTSVVRALGLNNASRKRFSEMAQRAAAAGYVQRKKSGNAGAAAAVWAEEAAKAKARDHWKMLQAAVVGDRPAKAVKSARHTT